MAEQTVNFLKEKFESGDKPTQTDFHDLIDSCHNANVSGGSGSGLPEQSEATSGQYLKSDGTSASWADVVQTVEADMDLYGMGMSINWTPLLADRVAENVDENTFSEMSSANVSGCTPIDSMYAMDILGQVWVCDDRYADATNPANWVNLEVETHWAVLPRFVVPSGKCRVKVIPHSYDLHWQDATISGYVYLDTEGRVSGETVEVFQDNYGGARPVRTLLVGFNSEGDCATHRPENIANGLDEVIGNMYLIMGEYDSVVMQVDPHGSDWQPVGGILITMNQSTSEDYREGDGWGNPARLTDDGKYFKRYTLSQNEYMNITEFILESATDMNNPYIIGSNGERKVIVRSDNAFLMMPKKNQFGDYRDFKSDDVYTIDTSYGSETHYLFCNPEGGITNFGRLPQRPLYIRDGEGLTETPIVYNGNHCQGFYLDNKEHFEFEAYPDLTPEVLDMKWIASGKSSLLFRNSNPQGADGWGNGAQLNQYGMVTRYTLSEDEYVDNITNIKYHNHQLGIEGLPTVLVNEDEVSVSVSGTHTAGATKAWFYVDASRDVLKLKEVPYVASLPITPYVENFLCAYWSGNDGDAPTWIITEEFTDIDYVHYIPYMVIFARTGHSHMHMQVIDIQAHGEVEFHHERVFQCEKYDRAKDAMSNFSATVAYNTYKDDDAINIVLNGGNVWSINHKNIISPVSSATEHYECILANDVWYYYDFHHPYVNTLYRNQGTFFDIYGVGQINEGVDCSTLINGHVYQIQDIGDTDWSAYGVTVEPEVGTIFQMESTIPITGTGTCRSALRVIIPEEYGIMYVYRGIENEDHLYSFLSPDRYNSVEEAKAINVMPPIPKLVDAHAMMVGRIIFKGQTVLAEEVLCESAFDTIFVASTNITNHNSLTDRDSNECHTQYVLVADGSLIGTTTTENISVGHSLYFDEEIENNAIGGGGEPVEINWTIGNKHRLLYDGVETPTITFADPMGVTNLTLKIVKSGVDASDLNGVLPTIKWSGGIVPTWTTTGTDLLNLYFDGTDYYGSVLLDMR